MSSNYDFILEYIYSDAFGKGTPAYNKNHKHGSLSYKNNVLYSYHLPIAIKFWHKGTHYVVASVGRGCSCTTSRHVYILSNNLWRGYTSDRVIPVYNVAELISDAALDHAGYKTDLRAWINRNFTDMQLCDSGLRQSLIDRMTSARNLAVLDPEYDTIAAIYERRYSKVDTLAKRNSLKAAIRRKAKEDADKAVSVIADKMLDSEDVLFDMLTYDVAVGSSDTRIESLFDGLTSPLYECLKERCESRYDCYNFIGKKLGYRISFGLPGTGILTDASISLKYVVDGDFGSPLVITLKSLFDHYSDDPDNPFECGTWKNVSDSPSFYKLEEDSATVSKVDDGSYSFTVVETISGSRTRTVRTFYLGGSIMQLLHRFVTTCREKLGRIAYREGEAKHGRRRSSTEQSESGGSSE